MIRSKNWIREILSLAAAFGTAFVVTEVIELLDDIERYGSEL